MKLLNSLRILAALAIAAPLADAASKKKNAPAKRRISSQTPEDAYKELKAWDDAVEKAKRGSASAIKAVFGKMRGLRGQKSAEYGFALMEIYKSHASPLLHEAQKEHGTTDCIMYFLVPESQEMPFYELEYATKSQMEKDKDPILGKFLERSTEYRQSIEDEKYLSLEHCRKYF